MQGFLEKQSGGKLDKKRSAGNALSKWDKRFFKLNPGSGLLAYYKTESDAQKGKPPAGTASCHGAVIEKPAGAAGHEFALRTLDRVLTMRAQSEGDASQWVAAFAGAGASPDPSVIRNRSTSIGSAANTPRLTSPSESSHRRTSQLDGFNGSPAVTTGGRTESVQSLDEILDEWDPDDVEEPSAREEQPASAATPPAASLGSLSDKLAAASTGMASGMDGAAAASSFKAEAREAEPTPPAFSARPSERDPFAEAAAMGPPPAPGSSKRPQLAPPLPQAGYLDKQSGGKLEKGRTLGNVSQKMGS